MHAVSKMKDRIDELAELMCEYKLTEAEMKADDFTIKFKKRSKTVATIITDTGNPIEHFAEDEVDEPTAPPVDSKPAGMPITSPMTGIYYASPSPSSPPFVKEGDAVSAGQIIGLIEAMKVFNEVPAPTSGTVVRITVESGQLVNLGDPLIYLG
jgi:acetyl-CoA carboxylase biotin carboxyl carrier protein